MLRIVGVDSGAIILALPNRSPKPGFQFGQALLDRLRANGQVAVRYAERDGTPAHGLFPCNPNASVDDIAGICDPSGRIFGLMPHPEAFLEKTNHPRWTREELPEEGAGLQLFRNAVDYARETLASQR